MFSLLKNRFGVPGLLAVIALVFAMIGGAYAANDNGKATASKAKKGPRGPRGPKGETGPAGPAGAAGPAGPAGLKGANGADGAKGATGAKGTNGSAGANGATGAVGAAGPAGAAGATGPEGSPWTAGGTLPSGETETGTFVTPPVGEAGGNAFVSASFTLPLDTALEDSVHILEPGAGGTEDCPGDYANPQAAPGQFCAYQAFGQGASPLGGTAFKSGVLMTYSLDDDEAFAGGAWAVTAP
jgi:Collagen triple helix repeat (20 copies)